MVYLVPVFVSAFSIRLRPFVVVALLVRTLLAFTLPLRVCCTLVHTQTNAHTQINAHPSARVQVSG